MLFRSGSESSRQKLTLLLRSQGRDRAVHVWVVHAVSAAGSQVGPPGAGSGTRGRALWRACDRAGLGRLSSLSPSVEPWVLKWSLCWVTWAVSCQRCPPAGRLHEGPQEPCRHGCIDRQASVRCTWRRERNQAVMERTDRKSTRLNSSH